MGKVTITTSVQQVGDDTAQLILSIPVAGSDESWNALEHGIRIEKWGKIQWQYVIDDPLMVPGIYNCQIGDMDKELNALLYGTDISFSIGNYPSVEVKINGASKFNGDVQEQGGMLWDEGTRTIDFTFTPGTMVLNTTRVYAKDCDTTAAAIRGAVADGDTVIVTTDTAGAHIPRYLLGTMVEIYDVVGMTDINGLFKISEIFYDAADAAITYKFRINVGTGQTYSSGGTAKQHVDYNPFDYAFNGYYPIKQILGDIFRLVNADLTDDQVEIFHDWIFRGIKFYSIPRYPVDDIAFTELAPGVNTLYFNPNTGISNVGDVLKRLAVDFCSFAGMVDKNTPFFKKLFHYNADNLQQLGMVKDRKFNYKYCLLEFVRVDGIKWLAVNPPVYYKGRESGLDERNLDISLLNGFTYYDDANFSSTINANIDRGSGNEIYHILQGKDPNLLSGALADSGKLAAEFWYVSRGNILKCREDKITVVGIGYDYLKDFPDQGRKYEPIGLTLDLDLGEAEFDAIYMGEVEA
jgi:hypothetical protein